MSDEELVRRFLEGDETSFRRLVERNEEKVRRVVYGMLNDATAVDDVAQEVFVRAYQGLGSFRGDSAFFTWLYRIAVNKCRDELRRRRFRRILSLQVLEEQSRGVIDEALAVAPSDESMKETLSQALSRLPDRFRLPVVLKDVDGLSYEEMSKVMQCRIGTVKSRLARGRAMLRKILTPLLEE